MIKSPTSTKMQSSSLTQSPDTFTQMTKFKLALTGLRISFNLTWKMTTHISLIHPLLNTGNDQLHSDQRCDSCIQRAFGGAGDAGSYTRAQLSEFWENILISAASRKDLEKLSRELIVPNTAIHGPKQYSSYDPRMTSMWTT